MIPNYILTKIKKQHELPNKAAKLFDEITDWYNKKIAFHSVAEDYWEIVFDDVHYISKEAISHNLELQK